MLGKLLKYDFRLMGRVLLPMFAVVLVLAVALGLMDIGSILSGDNVTGTFGIITFTVFWVLLFAIFVMNAVLTIGLFYKNLLGPEGYLMFTLPVRPWQLITSKLIVSTIFAFLSVIVGGLASFLLVVVPANVDWSGFWNELQYAFSIVHFDIVRLSLLMLLTMFTSIVSTYLTFYFSLAVGQMPFAGKHRILFSVITYVVLQIVLGALLMQVPINNPELYNMATETSLWVANGINVAVGIITFVGTNWILSKKLNLQ